MLTQAQVPARSNKNTPASPAGGEIANETGNEAAIVTTMPDAVRLDSTTIIDGTEVELTAHVKEVSESPARNGIRGAVEMEIEAVDKKARRSSTLSLGAGDVRFIVEAGQDTQSEGNGGTGGADLSTSRALEAFLAVLKKLTLFKSRRKNVFLLSYKGKNVSAPH